MPIKTITTRQEIDAYLAEQAHRTERAIVNTLAYVGEQCVNTARIGGSYRDQTGNLRSSVGYVIVKDGSVIHTSSFEVERQGGQGSTEGKQFAERKARQYGKGIVLIVVAGMNYAAYVSATGRDVLDSAELTADRLIPQLMQQLTAVKK
jgi:hypothetical protein